MTEEYNEGIKNVVTSTFPKHVLFNNEHSFLS